jgi:hypothetical protein
MVVFAADYPFLNIFGTMIIFFAWVIWIWMMMGFLTDVFRRRDLSGWGKAGWTVFLIVLPFLGALMYLVSNHDGMSDRSGRPATEIQKAKELLDSGAIDQSEFDALKGKALASA